MAKKLRKKLSQEEKESFGLVKDMVKKPVILKSQDFQAGQIIMYSYKAKYDKNPYDRTPMAMILMRSRKHTLALNLLTSLIKKSVNNL